MFKVLVVVILVLVVDVVLIVSVVFSLTVHCFQFNCAGFVFL